MKLLATCMFAAQAGAQKSPLLSTDLVYNTVELLTDARDFVWEKAKADALLAQGQMHVAKAKQEVLKQTGPLPPQVDDALLQASTAYVQVKALALEYYQKAYEPANQVAVDLIEKFESRLPAYKGLIPKTLGNFVLFVCYKAIVVFIVLKAFLFVLRLVLGIFRCLICGVLCCGCCRGSKTAAKATNGKKAANGKAATKAAAKPASKKK